MSRYLPIAITGLALSLPATAYILGHQLGQLRERLPTVSVRGAAEEAVKADTVM